MCTANLGGAGSEAPAPVFAAAGTLNRGLSAARASRTAALSSSAEREPAGPPPVSGEEAASGESASASAASSASSVSVMGSFSFCADGFDDGCFRDTHAAR